MTIEIQTWARAQEPESTEELFKQVSDMVSQQGVFGEPGYDCMLGKELWKREAGPSVLTGEEPRRRGRSTLLSDSSWRESLQKHMCALALRGGGRSE